MDERNPGAMDLNQRRSRCRPAKAFNKPEQFKMSNRTREELECEVRDFFAKVDRLCEAYEQELTSLREECEQVDRHRLMLVDALAEVTQAHRAVVGRTPLVAEAERTLDSVTTRRLLQRSPGLVGDAAG
jgi:hypothetical protein